MNFKVIHNPAYEQKSGFTRYQFQKLDQLYIRAASKKVLTYRTVECDFDAGVASYTYYQSVSESACFQFVIRRVGPQTTMFELFEQGKGRVLKSTVFDKVFARLQENVDDMIDG